MPAQRGHIKNGVVVLDIPTDAPDGTEVTVLIGDDERTVKVSEEELAVIDAGLSEARDGARIDAREFLRALRSGR